MQHTEGENQQEKKPELWLSASRITAYLECPYYYKLTHIDKVPTDTKGNYHTALGNGIHKVLEEMYKTNSYTLEFMNQWWKTVCYEGYIEKNGKEVLPLLTDPQYEYPNGDEETKMLFNHGKKLLREYYHRNKHEFGINEIVATELNFKIPIGKEGNIVLNGYIDRVDRQPNGALVVCDYKTGKEKTQEEVEWDTQLTLYAFAVRKLFDEVEGKLYLHFIKSGNKVAVTREKKHFDDLLNKIKTVKTGIENEQFEPKCGGMCRYCVYDCPIGGNAAFRKKVEEIKEKHAHGEALQEGSTEA